MAVQVRVVNVEKGIGLEMGIIPERNFSVWLLLGLFLLLGCGLSPSNEQAELKANPDYQMGQRIGCYDNLRRSHGFTPRTDGVMTVRPRKGARIVVWGTNAAAVGQATIWLQQRRFAVFERLRLQQIMEEQNLRLAYTNDLEAEILKASRILGADEVVLVDAGKTSVAVRSIHVETGYVNWSGIANYPEPIPAMDDQLATRLTAFALARVWGDPLPEPSENQCERFYPRKP